MIAMRDGVRLATDIYRPTRNGKPVPGRFPVILERTPYGKTVSAAPNSAWRSDPEKPGRGRRLLRVPRLCGDLPGLPRPLRLGRRVRQYLSDGLDGYDTCAWIVSQPWCDGKIGTMGLSYARTPRAR